MKLNLLDDLLIVPQTIYNAILQSFGGRFFGRCDEYMDQKMLTFKIYGKIYSIAVHDYFIPNENDPTTCILNVDQSKPDSNDQVQLGRGFLKNYCLFLDYEDMFMGFAERI